MGSSSVSSSKNKSNAKQKRGVKRELLQQDDEHVTNKNNNVDTSDSSETCLNRPKRKATNRHIFRLMQTTNPTKAADDDLMRALQASIELYPGFWESSVTNEDSASCSSSDVCNSAGSSSSSSSSSISSGSTCSMSNNSNNMHNRHINSGRRRKSHPTNSVNGLYSLSTVHNRYKPVARKNIYNEADFFHDGIMEYIQYELSLIAKPKRSASLDNIEDKKPFLN